MREKIKGTMHRVNSISYDDSELVSQAVKGNLGAYELLIYKYQNDIFKYCHFYMKNVALAEDLTQETFLKAFEKLFTFDSTYSFKTWLFTIAKNICINELNRRNVIPMISLNSKLIIDEQDEVEIIELIKDSSDNQAETLDKKQLYVHLENCITSLDQSHREVIIMKYFNNLKCSEIAQILNINKGTVWSRLHYAILKLKELLKEEIKNAL